ncbi:MAG: flagellin lysine-N-methylase [Chloroflexi bacterium]|nr:flagellin lysine-N-methylase [Chloroflexota bacterium]
MPRYLTAFRCVGGACEDTCCQGWNVQVDRPTFERYQEVAHPDLGPLLRSRVVANAPEKTLEHDAAHIVMEADGSCPFLTPDRWCGIQQQLGAELLPTTCSAYPRVTAIVDGQVQRAAQVSCPEIARLALLAPDALDLIEVNAAPARAAAATIQAASRRPGDPLHHFDEVRARARELMRRREVSVETRLLALGLAMRKLDGPTLTRAQVGEAFGTYSRQRPTIAEQVAGIAPRRSIQVALLRELTAQRLRAGSVSPRYQSCVDRMSSGLGLEAGDEAASVAAYEDAVARFVAPYVAANPHVLGNYLVNEMLVTPFPFSSGSTVFENYVMLVARYALVKLHLVGVAAFEQRLDDALVVEVIQPFQRAVDHHRQFLDHAISLLRQNDVANMAYMAILIVS